MKWKATISVFVLALAGLATITYGQYYPGGYGGYGGYGGGHASTAEEGIARGFADVVRSAGEANLRNSEAARNYEEARSRNLDNRLKATNTYFDMKERNKAYRDANRRPRATSEQLFRLARDKAPEKLNPTDVDPLTGEIVWPDILKTDEYKRFREKFEHIFAVKAQGHAQSSGAGYQEVQEAKRDFSDALRARIKQYRPSDYIAAAKFIDQLAREAVRVG